jgi:hypothetical protein
MSYLDLLKKAKPRGGLTEEKAQWSRQLTTHERIEVEIAEGPITAVLIDSPIVGPVWFAFADDFKSGDDIPVFFASELPFLRAMNADELRRRYADKKSLRGGWIRDRIDEPTKH